MKPLSRRWSCLVLLSLLSAGIVNQGDLPRALADSVTSTTLAGHFFSPTFGPSNDFFYTSEAFEETVNDAGVWRSNFLKIRASDFGIVSSTRVEFAIHNLMINSLGTYAYGSSWSRNSIAKINLTTMAVTEIQVTSLDRISGFEIDTTGSYGYVSGNKYNRTVSEREIYDNSVIKINLSTGATVGTLTGFEYNWSPAMYGIALHEDRNFGCVVDNAQGILQGFQINPFQWSNVSACGLVTGLNPAQIEFDRSRTYGYVSIGADKKLLKFNLGSGEVIKEISFPNYTNIFRISPSSTFAYVTDEEVIPSFLYKVSLSTFEVVEQIPFATNNRDIAISPNGLVGIVHAGETLTKINLSTSAPQTISFLAPTSKLTGAKSVTLNGNASSTLPVSYSSTTSNVCTVSGTVVSLLDEGDCTIVATQNGSLLWDPAVPVARTFKVFLTPPSSNTGISISAGKPFSNTKNVALEITWPEFADSVRLSNDGGFGSAVTVTKKLSQSTSWVLDDSVKGVYTKVVYARFSGEGIDTTKTFSDDIILDTTAPTINSSSGSLDVGTISLNLNAADDIAGLDKVEIRNGLQLISVDYGEKLTFNGSNLGVSAASSTVRKSSVSQIEFRISDRAGNWSTFKTVVLSGVGATPSLSSKKSATAKSIAAFAKLTISSTSRITLKVPASSAKYCKVSGTTLKGLKAGSCRVTVTVAPKKGRATSKTVTLKVSK